MIILCHGTGDCGNSTELENGTLTKTELWIPWAQKIFIRNDVPVLVVPGLYSSSPAAFIAETRRFLADVGRHIRPQARATAVVGGDALFAELSNAGTMKEVSNAIEAFGRHLTLVQISLLAVRLLEGRAGYGNGRWGGTAYFKGSAKGIKVRMAVAGLCAYAYLKWDTRANNSLRCRIVGHSRGGTTAMGIHNLISRMTVDGAAPVLDRTLLLDPIHGKVKVSARHLYYTTVWAGTVVDQPVAPAQRKGDFFGINWVFNRVEVQARGGNIHVQQPLQNTKHGHMGKLCRVDGERRAPPRQQQYDSMRLALDAHVALIRHDTLANQIDSLLDVDVARVCANHSGMKTHDTGDARLLFASIVNALVR